jgi:hypothetical protein
VGLEAIVAKAAYPMRVCLKGVFAVVKCGLGAILLGLLMAPNVYGFQWVRPFSGAIARVSFPSFEMDSFLLFRVRNLLQQGEVGNCGPTAAAMVISAYRDSNDHEGLEALRDEMGLWSWQRYPMRAWRLPGGRAGMTTPKMLLGLLQHFGEGLNFDDLQHPFLPNESYGLLALRSAIQNGRPVIVLVESSALWGTSKPGLHWVVITGVRGDSFIYNDPGDAKRWEIGAERLWRAWRLNAFFRHLPGVEGFSGWTSNRSLNVWPIDGGPTVSTYRPTASTVSWYEQP